MKKEMWRVAIGLVAVNLLIIGGVCRYVNRTPESLEANAAVPVEVPTFEKSKTEDFQPNETFTVVGERENVRGMWRVVVARKSDGHHFSVFAPLHLVPIGDVALVKVTFMFSDNVPERELLFVK